MALPSYNIMNLMNHSDNDLAIFMHRWVDMRNELSLMLSPIRSDQKYTMYSLRSSYINNQIDND